MSLPVSVTTAPPPPPPPVWAITTGSRNMWLSSSIRSHAWRYDICSARPAAEIDPVSLISSSRRILPGPIERSPPKSMRRCSEVLPAGLADRLAGRPIRRLCRAAGGSARRLPAAAVSVYRGRYDVASPDGVGPVVPASRHRMNDIDWIILQIDAWSHQFPAAAVVIHQQPAHTAKKSVSTYSRSISA